MWKIEYILLWNTGVRMAAPDDPSPHLKKALSFSDVAEAERNLFSTMDARLTDIQHRLGAVKKELADVGKHIASLPTTTGPLTQTGDATYK